MMLGAALGLGLSTAPPVVTMPTLAPLGLMTDHTPKLHNFGERKQRSVYSKKKLWSKNGYNLQVLPDGTVNGTLKDTTYVVLQFVTQMVILSSLETKEISIIKGVESNHYVCMNASGIVYGSKILKKECRFHHVVELNWHHTYKSMTFRKKSSKQGYLSIGKDGKVRPGNVSKRNQEMSQFMQRPVGQKIQDEMIKKFEHLFNISSPPNAVTPPAVAKDSLPAWETCTKKNKRKCCRGIKGSEGKRCRKKYGLKNKKKRPSRRKKTKSRTGKLKENKKRRHMKRNKKP